MNRSIRRATIGLSIAIATLGAGATGAGAGGSGFRTPSPTPPPPPPSGKVIATAPEKSTTCEGNIQCGVLEAACNFAGGTYNGWQSSMEGHDHAHGVCTWPWE